MFNNAQLEKIVSSEKIHKNVITLTDDIWINLPYELWTLDKFRASLMHKINHSFK